eukprot:scaffold47261_cov53-Cyclotella_meneghiniana.AAC.2
MQEQISNCDGIQRKHHQCRTSSTREGRQINIHQHKPCDLTILAPLISYLWMPGMSQAGDNTSQEEVQRIRLLLLRRWVVYQYQS